MLYPKIKQKKSNFKLYINKIVDNIKNLFINIILSLKSKEYFIIFMKKSFHL